MLTALYVGTILKVLAVVLGAKVKVCSRINLLVICWISIVIIDSTILSVSALIYLTVVCSTRYLILAVSIMLI